MRLSVAAPDWLQQHSLPDWWERYALPVAGTRLAKSEAEMEAVALTVGQDGVALLGASEAEPQAVCLREIPAVQARPSGLDPTRSGAARHPLVAPAR